MPIDTLTGEPVYAEAAVRGKKKEAIVQCALNACRMLDAEDILRESKKGTVAATAAFSHFALTMEVLMASRIKLESTLTSQVIFELDVNIVSFFIPNA